ncbi:hypothetical protein [Desertivirga brevis]|uniref:hypothetical protein n=1 Tax=Desertivirga brevis TaxID=2810310 RepID=UPI001A961C46|nr:hypothetical protein [Pedobacter sp. SYSU D00873]
MLKNWLRIVSNLAGKSGLPFHFASVIGDVNSGSDTADFGYDNNADFYYSNLINTLILFSLTRSELEKLSSPTFDPIFELETELDYAFTPLLFETLFRNKLVSPSLRQELLLFKQEVDAIPDSAWDLNFLEKDNRWISSRQKASRLLDKLDIDSDRRSL